MLRKIFSQAIYGDQTQQRTDEAYKNLIRKEAVIGGKLFGKVPAGHRREFFNLDKHTWVWHEEWTDAAAQKHVRNTIYDVRPDGVVKSHNGNSYSKISPSEASNLLDAIKLYYKRVSREVYGQTV